MKPEILLAVIAKKVEERLSSLPEIVGPVGPRGSRGHQGPPGQGFVFEDHAETIRGWAKELALKFSDLTPEDIASLKGPRGERGADGRPFVFSEYEDAIKSFSKEFALKFSDLSAEEIASLKGPRGERGETGRPFIFENHADRIREIISEEISANALNLKLTFADLSADDKEELRGPKGTAGRDGRDGRPFVFEEHREYFDSLKLTFADLSDEERDSLRLKFSQLSAEERDELKLRFADLTEDDRNRIRGPRGVKGQKGKQGLIGETGPRGERGAIGLKGVPGRAGLNGMNGIQGPAGRDGRDGLDAPWITDIQLLEGNDNFAIKFYFSDGETLTTQYVSLPSQPPRYLLGGSSGYFPSGEGGTGEQGPQGPPGADGADGADGTDGVDGVAATIEIGTVTTLSPGSPATVENVGDETNAIFDFGIPRGANGTGGGSSSELIELDCDSSVYVGAAARLQAESLTEMMIEDWPSLLFLPSMNISDYTPVAYNALADTIENSNVAGIVESKPSPTRCVLRVSGISEENYFGLNVEDEYYLSDSTPGQIVPSALMPDTPGHVMLKIGTPVNSRQLVYNRSDRTLVS